MPMGATNAPKHFHQVMTAVIQKLSKSDQTYIRHYQDDIFIAGESEDEKIQRMQRTIKLLGEMNLKINTMKTETCCKTILGFTLDKHTLSIPIEKKEKIIKLLSGNKPEQLLKACQILIYYKAIMSTSTLLTCKKLMKITNKQKKITTLMRWYADHLKRQPYKRTYTTKSESNRFK